MSLRAKCQELAILTLGTKRGSNRQRARRMANEALTPLADIGTNRSLGKSGQAGRMLIQAIGGAGEWRADGKCRLRKK